MKTEGTEPTIDHLRKITADNAWDIDFIVAANHPEPELCRIWDGRVSEPLSQSVIGDASILLEVERRFSSVGNATEDSKNFRLAFINAFTNRRVHLATGVGGFPLTLVARPEGHLYKWHSFSHTWKPIEAAGRIVYEDESDLLTGEWSFRHDLMTTDQPGVAVLAVEVPQAKTGFIYAPLLEDGPRPIKLLEQSGPYTQHQDEIHRAMRAALDAKVREQMDRFK
ncbi:MAG: hypothetical protein GC150_10995 [Rhizobiales bacterium]|nr:hypothetical protein [Hyphomicrobiales bacterium]